MAVSSARVTCRRSTSRANPHDRCASRRLTVSNALTTTPRLSTTADNADPADAIIAVVGAAVIVHDIEPTARYADAPRLNTHSGRSSASSSRPPVVIERQISRRGAERPDLSTAARSKNPTMSPAHRSSSHEATRSARNRPSCSNPADTVCAG